MRPFVLMSSVDLFQDQWRHVVAGKSTAVYSLPFSELHIDRNAEGRGNIFGCLQFTKYGNDIECNMLFELTRKKQGATEGKPTASKHDADEESDEDEEVTYGSELLKKDYAECFGVDAKTVDLGDAVTASLDEGLGADLHGGGGSFAGAAEDAMAKAIAGLVDEDLTLLETAKKDMLEKAITKKTITPQEIEAGVSQLCAEDGLQVEDAILEAALNSHKLIGNQVHSNLEEETTSEATNDPSISRPGVELCKMTLPQQRQASNTALQLYLSEMKNSVLCLLDCFHAIGKAQRAGQDGLSIVKSASDIAGTSSFGCSRKLILVHWEIEGKTGRVARVDDKGQLVSMVCVGQNKTARNFADCPVIHPGFGLWMTRVKKRDRPKLPTHILRVVNMFLQSEKQELDAAEDVLKQNEGWMDSANSVDECCAFCGRSSQQPVRCPLCLLPWHAQCSRELFQQQQPQILSLQWFESDDQKTDAFFSLCHFYFANVLISHSEGWVSLLCDL